jgi:restriction endonuclease S subunit
VGNVIYLQPKYFDEQGKVNVLLHPDLKMEGKIEKHLLHDGDLLFAAKGTKNFAVNFDGTIGLAVASSTFLVVRIKPQYRNDIVSEYLQWFINHPVSLQTLKGGAIGTDLPSISKSVLEELEVVVPPMEKQSTILKINELRNREVAIKRQLEYLRGIEIQQKLLKAANNHIHGE